MQNANYLLKEYNLSTDNFKQPKVDKGKKAVGMLIARLIILEPGTNPNHPEMGLGLLSKYRNMDKNNLSVLKKDLSNQLQAYLPQYSTANIVISAKDEQLIFDIKIDDELYKYVTVEQEDNKVTLEELIQ